ncbi:DUF3467 domain-containing protein [Candidatus Falkowbacteria bacterium]|nr:DUF3467 domain-containing protein [Candidatus Falkowbacteria bacterium]
MENPNQPQPPPQEIRIQDNFVGGEYANAMQVSHTKEEFVMAFFNIVPPNGRVCGKIITSPGHSKRMLAALQDNLKKYEEKFGPVEQAESPKEEIGFKV